MKRVYKHSIPLLVIVFTTMTLLGVVGALREVSLPKDQVEILESFYKQDWNRKSLEKPSGFIEGYLGSINLLSYYGEGRPILVIPGNFHSAHSYEETMRVLGKHFNMWSYSPRGTGSSAGDIDQSLEEGYEELRLVARRIEAITGQKPIGLGHSFGGYMLRTLPEKDELFSGLIFLSPAPEYGYAGRVPELVWNSVLDWFDSFHSGAEKFSFVYETWVAGSNASLPEIAAHARTIRYEPQAKMILESVNDECLSKKTNCPDGSDLPTLFVAIEDDKAVTIDDVTSDFVRVHKKFTNSNFEIIKGGHSFFDNEELALLLNEYFN